MSAPGCGVLHDGDDLLPQRSLGRPTTVASATAGCGRMAASTSSAKIFSPPELIVTESRPRSSMSPSAADGAVAGHG